METKEQIRKRLAAAENAINKMLRSCQCETRHQFCARANDEGGCDSDTCADAIWCGTDPNEHNSVTTVTIVDCACVGYREPWTVAFSTRENAEAFKAEAEKIIANADKSDLYRVVLDSGEIDDAEEYLEALKTEFSGEDRF